MCVREADTGLLAKSSLLLILLFSSTQAVVKRAAPMLRPCVVSVAAHSTHLAHHAASVLHKQLRPTPHTTRASHASQSTHSCVVQQAVRLQTLVGSSCSGS